MSALLEIQHLSVSFRTPQGEVEAVRDVSLSLRSGEVLAIVGESGCGKSVLCRSVMKLLPKNGWIKSGTILAEGTDITHCTQRDMECLRGRLFSMVFQDPLTALNPAMTVGAQIAEAVRVHQPREPRAAVRRRVLELLDLVGIPGGGERYGRYPHDFSGGMRQRAVMAAALASHPKILFADEPTTALDVTIQAQILELMQELRQKMGMSIIMITHDLGVVASMCERIAVMYAGHIVEYGSTDEIFYHPSHEYTKGLIGSIPKLTTEESERLVPIEGQPVDLLNPPAGCPFAPRCRSCMKVCLRRMPPKTQLSDTHYSYCWLRQKEAAEGGEKA